MKKIFILALAFMVAFEVSCAFADDLAVQAVSRNTAASEESESMSFDDVTFGKQYKIKGYASVNLLGFKFVNMYAQWESGRVAKPSNSSRGRRHYVSATKDGWNSYFNCEWKESGKEAEFAWLKADITNLQKTAANFMKEITVKIIYDNEYEYDGWVRQFNYDYSKSEIYRHQETTPIGWPVCLSPSDEMSISPMYKGHYAFGCTLPNFVVEDKESPLRMVITIGENTLTYNIRK